jgi:hypothetical protein
MAQGHKTLASVFETEAATFTKVVSGYTVPVHAMFREGDTLTALQARALSAYYLERGASVANSNIDRGSWSKLTDAEKVTKAGTYLSGNGEGAYTFSDDIGGEVFGASLLEQAALKVLANANAAKVAGMDDAAVRKALLPHVARFIHSPDATKYEDEVRATMAAILAERHEKRTRTAKAEGALEIAF